MGLAFAKIGDIRKTLWLIDAYLAFRDLETWCGGYVKVWIDEIKDGGWGE